MTVCSHIEIRLFQVKSKLLQINRLLTKFTNYGYHHNVLCGLTCVNLSGAGSVLVLHSIEKCRCVGGEFSGNTTKRSFYFLKLVVYGIITVSTLYNYFTRNNY